jgi:membrane dipeptidase
MMAFSVADIERAHREHKLAALMGIEGGHSIENDLHLLRDYYRLGVRYMTLSWSNTNEWADSSGDINDPKIQHHNGLTDFGKQVVLEMNRLGMRLMSLTSPTRPSGIRCNYESSGDCLTLLGARSGERA